MNNGIQYFMEAVQNRWPRNTGICNKIYHLFFFILFLSGTLAAQTHEISGTVVNSQTGESIPGTHVFIDNTTIGSTTDSSGTYHISNVSADHYRLVASFIGFQTFQKDLDLPHDTDTNTILDIRLEPETIIMDAIEVQDRIPREWRRNLESFKYLFLGETSNAMETEITNPEVLDFETEGDSFKAVASAPLIIKNNALGYEITFFLKELTQIDNVIGVRSNSLYREMEAESNSDIQRWKNERERTYTGSFMHFINSLVNGTFHDEGFRLYYATDRRRLMENPFYLRRVEWPQNLVKKLNGDERIVEFSLDDNYPFLRIDFLGQRPEPRIIHSKGLRRDVNFQTSILEFPNEKALIRLKSGTAIDPYAPLFYGYWGWTYHVPDRLPDDFSM